MSEVAIWNLALSHVGNDANVAGPTEQSRAAELCRQFYPIARKNLLETYDWNHATKRQALAVLEEEPSSAWRYAYGRPSNALTVFSVQAPDALSDTTSLGYAGALFELGGLVSNSTPQNFECEINASGVPVIYSSVPEAVARFTVDVTDTTKFPALFTTALSWLLASYLAGPLLKGETGRKESRNLLQEARLAFNTATLADARQRRSTDFRAQHTVWNRG